jgi:acyl carrier protein
MIRTHITSAIRDVAAELDKTVAPLDDDLVLLNSGLDSLCFAILVARLEDQLGVDPFTASAEAVFPVTLGEFIRAYESHAA